MCVLSHQIVTFFIVNKSLSESVSNYILYETTFIHTYSPYLIWCYFHFCIVMILSIRFHFQHESISFDCHLILSSAVFFNFPILNFIKIFILIVMMKKYFWEISMTLFSRDHLSFFFKMKPYIQRYRVLYLSFLFTGREMPCGSSSGCRVSPTEDRRVWGGQVHSPNADCSVVAWIYKQMYCSLQQG